MSAGDRILFARVPVAATLVLAFALAVALARPAIALGAPGAPAGPNPIQLENAKPGTTHWNLPGSTPWRLGTPSTQIQGYASEISLAPGDTLQLHVSTIPAAPYRVEIFRLGWYHGAGGRLIACLPACGASEGGTDYLVPAPDSQTGYLDASWPVTDAVQVGSGWTSGYFVAKLILTGGPYSGQASWVPFLVRAASGTRSAILVQASVNTWEAYNNWGGKSLYSFNSTSSTVPATNSPAAAVVSFNRPFANDSDFIFYEYNLVRFLEREGYDVSYQTDADTDQNPGSLLAHRLDIVSGHDEYWTGAMRNAFEAARAAGVNLAFLGGNIGVWQMRYGAQDRSLVEYRSASLDPDPVPSQKTVRFAQPPINRPECQLLGVGYPGGLAVAGDPPRSYLVTQAALGTPWAAGTGLSAGHVVYDSVGYEWDNVQRGCAVPPLTVLLHFAGLSGAKGSPASADAVSYRASSGATVISDGSLQFVWALDSFGHGRLADSGIQQLFVNIIDSLGRTPVAVADDLPQGLTPAPGALAGGQVTFSFDCSGPPGAVSGYALVIDGRPRARLAAGACRGMVGSLAVKLTSGAHSWFVEAFDPLGNTLDGASASLRVDATPPSRFALLSPRRRARISGRRPLLHWRRARDRVAGMSGYLVVIDGRVVAFVRGTSYRPRRPLRRGRHRWQVIALDRLGNRRPSAVWGFRVT